MISKKISYIAIVISIVFAQKSIAIEGISDSDLRAYSISSENMFGKLLVCESFDACVYYVVDDLYSRFDYAMRSEAIDELNLLDPNGQLILFDLYLDDNASVEKYEIVDKSGMEACDRVSELVIRATKSFPYLLGLSDEVYETSFRKFRVGFPCGDSA